MNRQKIQKITLKIFFPAMYFCAISALIGIWGGEYLDENYFRIIPTFFIIGLASIITWGVSVVIEFRNIAKDRK